MYGWQYDIFISVVIATAIGVTAVAKNNVCFNLYISVVDVSFFLLQMIATMQFVSVLLEPPIFHFH